MTRTAESSSDQDDQTPRSVSARSTSKPSPPSWNFSSSNIGQTEDDRVFEESALISITRNTISYGGSVYQFKNVTGFGSGRIPKDPPPTGLLFTLGGFCLVFLLGMLIYPASILISIFLGVIIFAIMNDYSSKTDSYGLVLYLNSGQERIFVCQNRKFLQKIMLQIYEFMEDASNEPLYIDFSQRVIHDRSIKVGGNFTGIANSGDDNNLNA